MNGAIPNPQSPIPRPRAAFTLIEILVVITIIGILVGLLVAAVGPARATVKTTRMKTELAQFVIAIQRFADEIGGGEYPPDFANNPASKANAKQFLRRAFPRCPENRYPAILTNYLKAGSTTPDPKKDLTPGNALHFWLAGPNGKGLSADPADPFDVAAYNAGMTQGNPSRIKPFYDFDRTRCTPSFTDLAEVQLPDVDVRQFRPQNDLGQSAPYVYLKAVAGQYREGIYLNPETSDAAAVMPFKDVTALGSTTSEWINPTSYQLLCPGNDGKFGTPGTDAPVYPDGNHYTRENYDDITNFSRGRLESDMQQ